MIKENNIPVKKTVTLSVYLLSLLLVAVISGGMVYLWQQSRVEKIKEVEVREVVVTPTTVKEDLSGWKVYRNEEYGIEFAYPDELSPLRENKRSGEGGHGFKLLIGRPKDVNLKDDFDRDHFIVAGDSVDFSIGRMVDIIDFQGYVRNGDDISLVVMADKNMPVEYRHDWKIPIELVKKIFTNEYGVEVIMVTGKDKPSSVEGMYFPVVGTAGEGRYSALINTKNQTLPGLVFIAPKDYPKEKFLKIMNSVKIF
jgi:hypothetical protein